MAIITKSLSTVLGIAGFATVPGTNRIPLSVIIGKITRLPPEDHLLTIPESKIFEYTLSQLTKVTSDSGDKILAYNGSRLVTVTDTAANTLSTFTYNDGGKLVNIVVTSI